MQQSATLIDTVFAGRGSRPLLRNAVIALAATGLLTLSAKVQVPFYPVPMTMQSLVVLVIGAAFGWRLGMATVMFYLLQGLAGLPVFAGTPEKGVGLAYMMGPTGGYLIGFVAAAFVTGFLVRLRLARGAHGCRQGLSFRCCALPCGDAVQDPAWRGPSPGGLARGGIPAPRLIFRGCKEWEAGRNPGLFRQDHRPA